MYGKITGGCLHGIDGMLIEVEADVSNGLPQVNIVGLPDSSVRESVERVRSAIKNGGFQFPLARITINLAPADLRKEGTCFDLAIAVCILTTSGQLSPAFFQSALVLGELSLDGGVRPVPGVLSMVHRAKQAGIYTVVLPAENAKEAELIEGMRIVVVKNVRELANPQWFEAAERQGTIVHTDASAGNERDSMPDFADVKGQQQAKRALAIAAAGMHNVILVGPPGSGKTMLMRRLPSILPPLSDEEAFQVTRIYSAANLLHGPAKFIRRRPFRAPHHTVSPGGLAGGGTIPKPGEVSLAHHGVLFLDELPEFSRSALEILRQPLEDRVLTISRARGSVTFPATFIFAASMNPCPCGYYGQTDGVRVCSCTELSVKRYRGKISGPLLDRIDMQVEVPRVTAAWSETPVTEHSEEQWSSKVLRAAVDTAHTVQAKRYERLAFSYNSELSGSALRTFCKVDRHGQGILKGAFEHLGLSARAYDRIIKVARTIADMEQAENIRGDHIAEAIHYRFWDRQL
ncbi:YifB family Mg chelatase-like AAA ATPase [Paenibacillus turpanensis]|uniref:YifB family Mg chelatase-like AAA ATPase n=1 Tax=Paenibacillus turpanensis TaxID=2689078 RepID=UPI00140B5936|nr:YifB family Mg chelatase-like AAA ATPase [Paenibacillus turpanensis]